MLNLRNAFVAMSNLGVKGHVWVRSPHHRALSHRKTGTTVTHAERIRYMEQKVNTDHHLSHGNLVILGLRALVTSMGMAIDPLNSTWPFLKNDRRLEAYRHENKYYGHDIGYSLNLKGDIGLFLKSPR